MKQNIFKSYQNIIYLTLALALGTFLTPFFGLIAFGVIYFFMEKGRLFFTKEEKGMLILSAALMFIFYLINVIMSLQALFTPLLEEPSALLALIFIK